MVTEYRGWPLGLGNLNQQFEDSQSQQEPVVPIQPQEQQQHRQEQISSHYPSTSFSSFSSSNIDSEKSPASFFQDQSVSLGRLIGMKPKEKKKPLYFSGTITFNRQCQCRGKKEEEEEEDEVITMMGPRICVPFLVCIVVKMASTCKSSFSRAS